MRPFPLKLRLIYLPFLGMAAGIILGYSLLNGWLTIRTAAIPLKEPVTDTWIPLILPFIVLAIWLRPAIKLLNLKTRRRSDLPFLYLLIAGLAIGIPTILLQGYLRTAMGKLTPLQSISRIRENKLTRYYTAKELYIDTALASFNNTAIVSGKNNQYLDFSIYIACPIFDRKPPTPVGDALPQAWACVKYTHQVSNRLDASERKEKWQTFVLATLEDFGHKDLNSLLYLDRIGNTEDRDNYEKAIGKNTYMSTIPEPLLILEPRFTAFETRNGHSLPWVFGSFAIGAVLWLIMLAIPKLNTSVLEGDKDAPTLKKAPAGNELKEMASLLLPRQGYAATPLIIDLNILVFVLMVIAGKGFINFQSDDLLAWGANYRPRTAGAGQWWRLLTSTFLHGGVMHLLFNMAGLLFAGILLEPALGKKRLTLLYLVTGIAASLTSLFWHPATVSVGASGAIFGLYGVFLALLTTKFFPPVFKKSFATGVVVFVGGNLLIGLTGGIDNAAHIGGLITGLLAGYIIYPGLKEEKEEKEVII